MSRPASGQRRGRVADYDAAAGYGTVLDDEGEWFFHCTAIVDGSRSIELDAEVEFALAPGHLGRMEARGLRPV